MTFLVNLMFSRLDKFDGPIIEGAYIRGEAYIRDVNWITYLGGWHIFRVLTYAGGGGGGVGVLAGFYGFSELFYLE